VVPLVAALTFIAFVTDVTLATSEPALDNAEAMARTVPPFTGLVDDTVFAFAVVPDFTLGA
jgi:hypothetical protein